MRGHSRSVEDVVTAMLVGKDMQDVSLGKVFPDHNKKCYKLTIEHGEKFDASIGYVSLGMSFSVVSRSI